MKIDSKPQYAPGISEFIDKVNSVYPPDSYKKDISIQRALYSELGEAFPVPEVTDVSSRDVIVPHFNVEKKMRIYTPKNIKKRWDFGIHQRGRVCIREFRDSR